MKVDEFNRSSTHCLRNPHYDTGSDLRSGFERSHLGYIWPKLPGQGPIEEREKGLVKYYITPVGHKSTSFI